MGKVLMSGVVPKLKVPMNGTPLGDFPVGTTVKLNVNGTPTDFIIVNQGIPSNSSLYDGSCNDTWLLMKDVYSKQKWNPWDDSIISPYGYQESALPNYLNDTFLPLLDKEIQLVIKTVKIPYLSQLNTTNVMSGSNGLSTKVFLLSAYEFGGSASESNSLPVDGAVLEYFSDTSSSNRSKRIAYYADGVVSYYWTRSGCTNYGYHAVVINESGGFSNANTKTEYGIRPAFILPSDTECDKEPNADGSVNLKV